MIKKLFVGILLLNSLLFSNSINIAVAANVSYAINELVDEFNITHPDIKVNITLGGSGKLSAQIFYGAPYDIFMSANMKYPQAIYAKGLSKTKPVIYAYGSLAILSAKKRDLSQGLSLLKDVSIKRIAIANPKTAPYGVATLEALKNTKLLEKVKPKFIYGESISATVSYTVMATDLGVIAASSLYSPKMVQFKKDENWVLVNPKLYTPIEQGIVIIKETKQTRAFYDFIFSKEAKLIFKNYGYTIP